MSSINFVIRDALASDVEACLALDHSYETEYVWQMSLLSENDGWQVRFRKERLPRPIDVQYPMDTTRLKSALVADACYLVAASKAENTMLGYLTMRLDKAHKIGLVQDIVVSRPLRHNRIGQRLLGIARRWAQERSMKQLLIETQTKNYPAIEFCQQNGFSFCGFNDQYFRNQDIAVFFGQTLR